jgi:hypothetical protein
VKEASLLGLISPAVTMTVPDITLHPRPAAVLSDTKLKGDHLVTAQYYRLPEEARQLLAGQLCLALAN